MVVVAHHHLAPAVGLAAGFGEVFLLLADWDEPEVVVIGGW